MIEIVRKTASLVELRASGTLTREDYERVGPLLEAHHSESPEVNYLLTMDGFEGAQPAALWKDLKFTWKHRDDLARTAVVGDPAWQELTVKAASTFLPGEVRFYPSHQLISARNWVSQGRHSGATRVE